MHPHRPVTRSISEISSLSILLGGRRETCFGLAGVGDLIVTCFSEHSRNQRAGLYIGQGETVEEALRHVGAAQPKPSMMQSITGFLDINGISFDFELKSARLQRLQTARPGAGVICKRQCAMRGSSVSQPLVAALTMTAKSGAFREAPPIRPPSTSSCW